MKTELVVEVKETITAQDMARSLWIIYQQMPDDAQKVFKDMVDNEPEEKYENAGWLSLFTLSLKDIWDQPEEDYWDELYAKQHPAK